MSDRPNVLWICTDQQRFDTLSGSGNPHVRTPNLDRLAASGVLFENAFCQNPVCTPSRASFLTGRYPRTTRCRQNGQSLPPDEAPVTRLLRDAGYVCGLSGKLHLSACEPKLLQGRQERRVDDGYTVFHWHHDHWPCGEYGAWLRRQGISGEISALEGKKHVQVGPPSAGTPTAWAADMADRFIRDRQGSGAPWLFSLNTFDPHHPFRIPADRVDEWRERADGLPLPTVMEQEWDRKPLWQGIDHAGAYGGNGMAFDDLDDDGHRWVRAAYYAMVENVDEQVGRLLDTLEETGARENTLVIFTSDHGEMLGDHGIYLKGPYFYDPAVRVPLIVSWPGQYASGLRSDAMAELVDLAPTLLEAAGLPVHPGMQGRSLDSVLTGRADTHRDDVYCEFYNSNFHYDPKPFATMVRTPRHKLVACHGQDDGELYDLDADPAETKNLWRDPARLPVKAALLERLCARMAETVDPLPLREAAW